MSKPKVVVRVIGGLGNQLFSYAAARRLALAGNAELVIDNVSGFVHDHAYRRGYQLDHFLIPCRLATAAERMEPFSRVRRYLKRRASSALPFEQRPYLQQEGVDFDPRLLEIQLNGTRYIEGYWQSERYFKDVEATIRDDLRITPPTDQANLDTARRMNQSPSIALHVRFFEGPGEEAVNTAPQRYYGAAVDFMEQQVPGAHYFVFSDQPQRAAAILPLPPDRYTVVSHNVGDETAYADLWLMTQARHFITANSTFSWWGAWLAKSQDKIIVTPGFELRKGHAWWGFEGLLPSSWIKLDV